MKDAVNTDKFVTEKAKARFVVRGFRQVQGLDFHESFAAVVNLTSIRAVLALTTCLDLKLREMDVVTAFLTGTSMKRILRRYAKV